MKKLVIGFLAVALLVGVSGEVAQAAEWRFHYYYDGWLQVDGTINCFAIPPTLFSGYGQQCQTVSGWVPFWCNDFRTIFTWDWTCGNVDTHKVAVPSFLDPIWELLPVANWLETNLGPEDSLVLPTIGDSTGAIQYVHVVMNLAQWLVDPRPLQDIYDVIDGECDDLPGYLIGTTPITFDSLAGSGNNPFGTTPLTGTLFRDGEIIFTPEKNTCTEQILKTEAGAADDLVVSYAGTEGTLRDVTLTANPPGCNSPTIEVVAGSTIRFTWPEACVDEGETVAYEFTVDYPCESVQPPVSTEWSYPQTPALTEWGLIILVALILLSAWVVLRRRKAVLSRQ